MTADTTEAGREEVQQASEKTEARCIGIYGLRLRHDRVKTELWLIIFLRPFFVVRLFSQFVEALSCLVEVETTSDGIFYHLHRPFVFRLSLYAAILLPHQWAQSLQVERFVHRVEQGCIDRLVHMFRP